MYLHNSILTRLYVHGGLNMAKKDKVKKRVNASSASALQIPTFLGGTAQNQSGELAEAIRKFAERHFVPRVIIASRDDPICAKLFEAGIQVPDRLAVEHWQTSNFITRAVALNRVRKYGDGLIIVYNCGRTYQTDNMARSYNERSVDVVKGSCVVHREWRSGKVRPLNWCNGRNCFWLPNGTLVHEGTFEIVHHGPVLTGTRPLLDEGEESNGHYLLGVGFVPQLFIDNKRYGATFKIHKPGQNCGCTFSYRLLRTEKGLKPVAFREWICPHCSAQGH